MDIGPDLFPGIWRLAVVVMVVRIAGRQSLKTPITVNSSRRLVTQCARDNGRGRFGG